MLGFLPARVNLAYVTGDAPLPMKPDCLEVFGGHVKAGGLSGSEIDAIKRCIPSEAFNAYVC